jgi:spore coat polysaccharide biosynthesis predicted glycosyltransferase SpsG
VILDDYALTKEDAHQLQAHGLWTIGINDIPADALPCNVIINHLPAAEKNGFDHLPEMRLLLGSAYLMLRKPFLDALKNHRQTSPQSGLIIALGGTDPEQLTEKFLQAAIELGIAPVHLVTSHLNNRLPALRERCNEAIHLHIGLNADEMVALIQSCKFSLLTASTLTLEAMCVGSCIATGYTHENQKMIAATCEKHHTALNAGDLHTANALDVLSQLILMNADELKMNQYNLMKAADPENFKNLLKDSF